MTKLFFVSLSVLVASTSFAQFIPKPATTPVPVPPTSSRQVIEVISGTSTVIAAQQTTEVRCVASPAVQAQANLRCTIMKTVDTGNNDHFSVYQNGREISSQASVLKASVDDLMYLKQAGVCQ